MDKLLPCEELVRKVADSIELAFTTQSRFPATILCRDEVNYKRIAELAIATMQQCQERADDVKGEKCICKDEPGRIWWHECPVHGTKGQRA